MAASNGMTRLLRTFQRLENAILHWIGIPPPPGLQVALVNGPHVLDSHQDSSSSNQKSLLEEIFDSTLFAVPRNRVTLQRRKTRHMSLKGHYEYAIPKKNIISCLECGNWHEKETICGHCYEKVKEETQEMQSAMGVDALQYEAPRSEVVFLYEGEEKESPTFNGKHIVEMKKPRPQWFSQNLMTKGHTQ